MYQYTVTASNEQQFTHTSPRLLLMSRQLTVWWYVDCCGSIKNMTSPTFFENGEKPKAYIYIVAWMSSTLTTQRDLFKGALASFPFLDILESKIRDPKLSKASWVIFTWCRLESKHVKFLFSAISFPLTRTLLLVWILHCFSGSFFFFFFCFAHRVCSHLVFRSYP